jgi:3-oxoacyl-[acyl-carrier-protein] synthase III
MSGLMAAGIEIAGVGAALPSGRMTNADLEKLMDTSDEWIVQRTGIRERRIANYEAGDSTTGMAIEATRRALADAKLAPADLDLIVVATMTPDMPTPGVSSVLADRIGAGTIGAMDINGACSGFVFALNTAAALMNTAGYRTVAVVGADCITRHVDYSTFGRGTAILFGDAAAAVILQAGGEPSRGLIAQRMHADGAGSRHLFVPMTIHNFPEGHEFDQRKLGVVQMNGAAVFKFAVKTFGDLIDETLQQANLRPEDVDHYICHQSNKRILDAARDRFGLDEHRMLVNIDRYGNTVAASIPLALHELRAAGRVREGQRVMFLAFGAGLTWGSSLWQL